MSRKDLFEKFYEKCDGMFPNKAAAKAAFNNLFDVMSDALIDGEELGITGFGKFYFAKLKARNGINPRTKEPMVFPEHRVVRFDAAKSLADSIR